MEIALSCVDVNRYKRPSIREIVKKLNETETVIHKASQLPAMLCYDQGSSMDQVRSAYISLLFFVFSSIYKM
jgi:interleukin-1 receptor-associated kinase 1/coatomer subunit beta'